MYSLPVQYFSSYCASSPPSRPEHEFLKILRHTLKNGSGHRR